MLVRACTVGYQVSPDFCTIFLELFPGGILYEKLPHRVVTDYRVIEIKHHGITYLRPGSDRADGR